MSTTCTANYEVVCSITIYILYVICIGVYIVYIFIYTICVILCLFDCIYIYTILYIHIYLCTLHICVHMDRWATLQSTTQALRVFGFVSSAALRSGRCYSCWRSPWKKCIACPWSSWPRLGIPRGRMAPDDWELQWRIANSYNVGCWLV